MTARLSSGIYRRVIWTALVNTVLDDEEGRFGYTTGRLAQTPPAAVFSYPSGFPIAIAASSPTARFDELVKLAAVRNARRIIDFQHQQGPSRINPHNADVHFTVRRVVATICPLLLATWLFVTIYPFLSMITPDLTGKSLIVMETTEGAAFLATVFRNTCAGTAVCVDVLPPLPVEFQPR